MQTSLSVSQQAFINDLVTKEIKGFTLVRRVVSIDAHFPNAIEDKNKRIKYNYQVTYNGKTTDFDFYGSAQEREDIFDGQRLGRRYTHHQQEDNWIQTQNRVKKAINEANRDYNFGNALHCFVSDALAGSDTFEEFCFEFGYNKASRKAERIYFACQELTRKLKSIYSGDWYELINTLSEKYA